MLLDWSVRKRMSRTTNNWNDDYGQFAAVYPFEHMRAPMPGGVMLLRPNGGWAAIDQGSIRIAGATREGAAAYSVIPDRGRTPAPGPPSGMVQTLPKSRRLGWLQICRCAELFWARAGRE